MRSVLFGQSRRANTLNYSPGKETLVVAGAGVLKPEDALHVAEELARLADVLRVVELCHHRELVRVLQVSIGVWCGLRM